MKKVKSSNLDSLDYDEATKLLTVVFKNGTSYTYSGVPKATYTAFESAESCGTFFHKHIRARFEYAKVPPQKKDGGKKS